MQEKIKVFEAGELFLLYDFEGYKKLRVEHRLVGAPIGQIPAFKQQAVQSAIPVALTLEETYLCLQKGLIEIRKSQNQSLLAEYFLQQQKKRRRIQDDEDDSDDDDDDGGENESIADKQCNIYSKRTKTNGSQQNITQLSEQTVDQSWKQKLLQNEYFEIPLADEGEATELPPFTAKQQAYKCAIFKDLHDKGYYLSNGSKFGFEYLVYPGDPSVFHSQFTVRIVMEDEVLNPVLLGAMCRGSHQARKHLLLAYTHQKQGSNGLHVEDYVISYVSVAPESGFG